MKKIVTLILVSCILLSFCGCIGNFSLSERELIELLPEEIYTIYVTEPFEETESFVLAVDSIEIQKRKTDESEDYVDCIVTMKNEDYTLTSYLELYLSYYDTGGWILDTYNTMGISTISTTKTISQEMADNIVGSYVDQYGSLTPKSCEISENGDICSYVYETDSNEKYLTRSGTLLLEFSLGQIDQNYFDWQWYFDDSQLTKEWNIIGHWEASSDKTQFSFDVTDVSDTGVIKKENALYWTSETIGGTVMSEPVGESTGKLFVEKSGAREEAYMNNHLYARFTFNTSSYYSSEPNIVAWVDIYSDSAFVEIEDETLELSFTPY